jgi:hypothetical protein
MPKGPKGEKRLADVIANAVRVMRIAAGEEEEDQTTAQKKHMRHYRTFLKRGKRRPGADRPMLIQKLINIG